MPSTNERRLQRIESQVFVKPPDPEHDVAIRRLRMKKTRTGYLRFRVGDLADPAVRAAVIEGLRHKCDENQASQETGYTQIHLDFLKSIGPDEVWPEPYPAGGANAVQK